MQVLVYFCQERTLFPSLHHHTFSPKGVARLSFTARIGRLASFQMILPSLLATLPWSGTRVDPTAAVERGYRCSLQARSFSLRDGG